MERKTNPSCHLLYHRLPHHCKHSRLRIIPQKKARGRVLPITSRLVSLITLATKIGSLLQTITAEHENHRFPDKPFTYNPHFDKRKEKWWNSYPAWWQNNYEPNFSCQLERRIGGPNGNGDGPKWICDPHQIQRLAKERKAKDPSHPGCVIYSIGSKGDFSFELGMQQQVGKDVCEYHIFDVNDYTSQANQVGLGRVHFHHWGLRSQDSKSPGQQFMKLKSGYTLKGLHDIVKELGHEHLETIDIFKIDCEGCEWTTFQDWVSPNMPRLQQIQVELHEAPLEVIDFFNTLENAGYVRTHKEPNIQFGPSSVEYAFLKLDKEFFSARKHRQGATAVLDSATR